MAHNRIQYLDIAKGIGIILVVWFHFPILSQLSSFECWGGYITSFYMVLFFVLSGVFFKLSSLLRRIRRLMLPYISFYLVACVYYTFMSLYKQKSIELSHYLLPFLGATSGYENTPIWFLLSLSQVVCMCFVLCKMRNRYAVILGALCVSMAGYYLGRYNVPYYVDVSMLCLFPFVLGYEFRDVILDIRPIVGLPAGLLSLACYAMFPGFTNVSQNFEPMGYIPFLGISIGASLFVVYVSKAFCHTIVSTGLSFFGRNSLIILCTHMMLMSLPAVIARHLNNVWCANLLSLILVMCIECLVVFLIKKYVKFLDV